MPDQFKPESDSEPKVAPETTIDRVALLQLTIFVEAFILLGATFWSKMAELQLGPLLIINGKDFLIGGLAGVAMAVVSIFLFWLGKYVKPLEDLRSIIMEQLAPVFSQLKWLDVFLIAIISGFCEEVMFRGVVQGQFQIWVASIAFGLFHCPSFRHISYGLWALAAGLMLGWLVNYTGNLWPAIVAHAVSNLLSLTFLRYRGKTAV